MSGMDLLCDAIGPELLSPRYRAQSLSTKASDGGAGMENEQTPSPNVSRDNTASQKSVNRDAVHQCKICNRSYERADHLNRHLRSRKLSSQLLTLDTRFKTATRQDNKLRLLLFLLKFLITYYIITNFMQTKMLEHSNALDVPSASTAQIC